MEDVITIIGIACLLGFLAEYMHRSIYGRSLLCRLGFHRVDADWLADGKGNAGFHYWCRRKGCRWTAED